MTNQVYGSWLENMMDVYFKSEAHWTANPANMYVCGVDAGYVFNTNHHEVEDLGAHVVLPPVAMTEVTTTLGVLDAADVETNTDEQIGEVAAAAVIFIGNDDGSQLLVFIDQGEEGQLPITFVNGKLFVRWNAAGILRI